MSNASFGVACFHFSPKACPPFRFRGTEYLAHLRRALESVPSISAVRFTHDDLLKNMEHDVQEVPQPLFEGGEPFPRPAFMTLQFEVYVPFRVQADLLSNPLFGQLSAATLQTYTEKFRVTIFNLFHGPVAFVEPLAPSNQPDPSEAVIIVRNFRSCPARC